MNKRELKRQRRRINEYNQFKQNLAENPSSGVSAYPGVLMRTTNKDTTIRQFLGCADDESRICGVTCECDTFGDFPKFIYNDISGEDTYEE